jgi:hypothetical protein
MSKPVPPVAEDEYTKRNCPVAVVEFVYADIPYILHPASPPCAIVTGVNWDALVSVDPDVNSVPVKVKLVAIILYFYINKYFD